MITPQENGALGLFRTNLNILNVSAGDTKLVFGQTPEERDRAAKIVTDMLRMGYAIMIEVDDPYEAGKKLTTRVHSFDPKTYEYIIGEREETNVSTSKRKPRRGRVNVYHTRGVAIGPSAGG